MEDASIKARLAPLVARIARSLARPMKLRASSYR
jgi:hypothetical protein